MKISHQFLLAIGLIITAQAAVAGKVDKNAMSIEGIYNGTVQTDDGVSEQTITIEKIKTGKKKRAYRYVSEARPVGPMELFLFSEAVSQASVNNGMTPGFRIDVKARQGAVANSIHLSDRLSSGDYIVVDRKRDPLVDIGYGTCNTQDPNYYDCSIKLRADFDQTGEVTEIVESFKINISNHDMKLNGYGLDSSFAKTFDYEGFLGESR